MDVAVVAPAEIYPFKGTCRIALGGQHLFQSDFPSAIDDNGLSRKQFLNVVLLQIEGGLQNGAFAGDGADFIVFVVEGGTDSPRVTHREHLTTARHSAHHISAIEMRQRGFQDVSHVHVIVDIFGHLLLFQSQSQCFLVATFHLSVKTVPHQLQQNVRIAVNTRVLTFGGEKIKDFLNVGHIEIAAQA